MTIQSCKKILTSKAACIKILFGFFMKGKDDAEKDFCSPLACFTS